VSQEVRESDQHGGQADEAVEHRDQLRHLGHLHAPRSTRPMPPPITSAPIRTAWFAGDDAEHRGGQGDRHAEHAEEIAARADSWLLNPPSARMNRIAAAM
jgi:hypothetical protein